MKWSGDSKEILISGNVVKYTATNDLFIAICSKKNGKGSESWFEASDNYKHMKRCCLVKISENKFCSLTGKLNQIYYFFYKKKGGKKKKV